MAKTFQNLIDEARTILQDTDETAYRHTAASLLAILNRGIQELARLRPDAFIEYYDPDRLDVAPPEVVDTDATPDTDPDAFDATEDAEIGIDDDFTIPSQFYAPLVYFVAGSAELVDDEFTTDGRAAMMLAGFKAQVLGL